MELFYKLLLVFVYFSCSFDLYYGENNDLLVSCGVKDIKCLGLSTEKFLEKTSKGIPQYDLRPIDPLTIAELDIAKASGPQVSLKNVTITGLKDQKISDFQMDTASKSVELKCTADVNVTFQLNKVSNPEEKSLIGMSGKTLMTASYPYTLKPYPDGHDHFEVGAEKITCEIIGDVVSDIGHGKNEEPRIENEELCKIMNFAYKDVIHNIRASAKLMPKEAFFKDL